MLTIIISNCIHEPSRPTTLHGRTGRVINILYLIQEELLTLPILYLSRHLIQNKADYYRLLLAVSREQAWEPWLLFMLQAVEETARWTTDKIAAIRALAEHTTRHVREHLPKIYSTLPEGPCPARRPARDAGWQGKTLHPPEIDAAAQPRQQRLHALCLRPRGSDRLTPYSRSLSPMDT